MPVRLAAILCAACLILPASAQEPGSLTVTLSPSDDAYVRDGRYDRVNYGKAPSLIIKRDSTGYARKALLKFDLSAIPGNIESATLQLFVTFAGTGAPSNHYARPTQANDWSEGNVSWSNMPALGAATIAWPVPPDHTALRVDFTAAAQSAQAGGKVLSFAIDQAVDQGANAPAEYGSRDNPNPAHRPSLVVTYRKD